VRLAKAVPAETAGKRAGLRFQSKETT
jgi:hypothetical protein